MTLKTSFCNIGIIKSKVKKLLPICILHILVMLLAFTDCLLKDFNGANFVIPTYMVEKFGHLEFYKYLISIFICSFIFPLLLAVIVFSYLHSTKRSTFYHSIPLLRRTIYISNYISGVILFLVPIIINLFAMLLLRMNGVLAATYKLSQMPKVFAAAALFGFFVFSCGVFVSLITKNTVASSILSCLLAALPVIFKLCSSLFLTGGIDIQNYIYLNPANLSIFKFVLYALIGTILTISGYYIYKMRRLKCYISISLYLIAAVSVVAVSFI